MISFLRRYSVIRGAVSGLVCTASRKRESQLGSIAANCSNSLFIDWLNIEVNVTCTLFLSFVLAFFVIAAKNLS
jgi:hypothetical protein